MVEHILLEWNNNRLIPVQTIERKTQRPLVVVGCNILIFVQWKRVND